MPADRQHRDLAENPGIRVAQVTAGTRRYTVGWQRFGRQRIPNVRIAGVGFATEQASKDVVGDLSNDIPHPQHWDRKAPNVV